MTTLAIQGSRSTSLAISPSASSSSLSLPQKPAGQDFDIATLKLLHFYTTTTSLTLYALPSRHRVWTTIVPEIAFLHPFLLHGLLAITALHRARLQSDPTSSLWAEASFHHQNALSLFRSALSNVTIENCDACFAFSSILAIYAWASSGGTGDLFFIGTSRLEQDVGPIEWFQLLRGASTLLKTFWADMEKGPLSPILKLWEGSEEPPDQTSPEDDAKFLTLMRLWDPSPGNLTGSEVDALNKALNLLRHVYGQLPYFGMRVCAISATFSWPVQVPDVYIEMVQKRQPEALILLAHYCLLLNRVNNFWWIQGMSRHLLENIHQSIGTKLESWIGWPLQDLVLSEFKHMQP